MNAAASRRHLVTSEPTAAPDQPLAVRATAIDLIGGRYEPLDHLGSTASGATHRCHDVRTGREVAVTGLHRHLTADPSVGARFTTIGQSLVALRSPFVNQVLELVRGDAGEPLLVSRHQPGLPISLAKKRSGLGVRAAVRLATDVARGLHDLHAVGIAHGELSTANVVVTDCGNDIAPVISGLAAIAVPLEVMRPVDVAQLAVHLAPERIDDLPEATPEADAYSLGVLLFELLTDRTPFEATSPGALLRAHASEPAPALNGLPQPLVTLVCELLAKDPSDRATVAAAIEQLEAIEGRVDDRAVVTVESEQFDENSDTIESDISPTIAGLFGPGPAHGRRPAVLATPAAPSEPVAPACGRRWAVDSWQVSPIERVRFAVADHLAVEGRRWGVVATVAAMGALVILASTALVTTENEASDAVADAAAPLATTSTIADGEVEARPADGVIGGEGDPAAPSTSATSPTSLSAGRSATGAASRAPSTTATTEPEPATDDSASPTTDGAQVAIPATSVPVTTRPPTTTLAPEPTRPSTSASTTSTTSATTQPAPSTAPSSAPSSTAPTTTTSTTTPPETTTPTTAPPAAVDPGEPPDAELGISGSAG